MHLNMILQESSQLSKLCAAMRVGPAQHVLQVLMQDSSMRCSSTCDMH
jgi:hypothetical protein